VLRTGNDSGEHGEPLADAAAERILKEAEFLNLTRRDRMAFVQALMAAPASPNAKLCDAAERYARLFLPS
jgi:uncharacterized protein (DUF1778 family)